MLPNNWSFDLFSLVEKWHKRLNSLGYKTDREETFFALTIATGILLKKYDSRLHSLCSMQIASDLVELKKVKLDQELTQYRLLITKYVKSGMRPKATPLYNAAKQELKNRVARLAEADVNMKKVKLARPMPIDSPYYAPHNEIS